MCVCVCVCIWNLVTCTFFSANSTDFKYKMHVQVASVLLCQAVLCYIT